MLYIKCFINEMLAATSSVIFMVFKEPKLYTLQPVEKATLTN